MATKFSRRWDAAGAPYSDIGEASIRLEVENSLKRLDIEVIDLYQMHWPRPDEQLESAWEVVGQLVKEGKVRYAGVCNFSVAQLERILPVHPVASLQPPYSMLRRGVEDGLLEFCAKNQIGVVAYSPMQKGILTDKFTARLCGWPGLGRPPPARSGLPGAAPGQAFTACGRIEQDRLQARPEHGRVGDRLGAEAERGDLSHCRGAQAGTDRRDCAGCRVEAGSGRFR